MGLYTNSSRYVSSDVLDYTNVPTYFTEGNINFQELGIVAAALLLAARIHGFRRTKKDILSVIHVSDETLRARLAEFESTAASFFFCFL